MQNTPRARIEMHQEFRHIMPNGVGVIRQPSAARRIATSTPASTACR
jgi:hypothetical protein